MVNFLVALEGGRLAVHHNVKVQKHVTSSEGPDPFELTTADKKAQDTPRHYYLLIGS